MTTLDTDQLVSAWLHLFGAELDRTIAAGDSYKYAQVATRASHHLVELAERLPKTPEPAASGHVIDELVTRVEFEPGPAKRLVPRREASVSRDDLIAAAKLALSVLEGHERAELLRCFQDSVDAAHLTRHPVRYGPGKDGKPVRREVIDPRVALIEVAEKAVDALEVPERVALFQRYPTSAGTALGTRPAPFSARRAIAETDLPSDMSSADAIRTLWERLESRREYSNALRGAVSGARAEIQIEMDASNSQNRIEGLAEASGIMLTHIAQVLRVSEHEGFNMTTELGGAIERASATLDEAYIELRWLHRSALPKPARRLGSVGRFTLWLTPDGSTWAESDGEAVQVVAPEDLAIAPAKTELGDAVESVSASLSSESLERQWALGHTNLDPANYGAVKKCKVGRFEIWTAPGNVVWVAVDGRSKVIFPEPTG